MAVQNAGHRVNEEMAEALYPRVGGCQGRAARRRRVGGRRWARRRVYRDAGNLPADTVPSTPSEGTLKSELLNDVRTIGSTIVRQAAYRIGLKQSTDRSRRSLRSRDFRDNVSRPLTGSGLTTEHVPVAIYYVYHRSLRRMELEGYVPRRGPSRQDADLAVVGL